MTPARSTGQYRPVPTTGRRISDPIPTSPGPLRVSAPRQALRLAFADNSNTRSCCTTDPLSWNQLLVIDPLLALGTLGAPLRHYTLSDLRDLPPCTGQEASPAGCIPLRSIRMAVLCDSDRSLDLSRYPSR